MKKQISCALTLLSGALAVYAQGTVSLANYGVLSPYIYASYRAIGGQTVYLGGSGNGPQPTIANFALEFQNGNDWTVELYGAAGANDSISVMQPLGVTATLANGVGDSLAGTWAARLYAEVPGTTGAGSIATVQLYLWYNEGGAITSYAQAVSEGVPTADSALANVVLGGPSQTGPPTTAASLPSGLGNLTISPVPESGTVALGVVGGGVALVRGFLRRRERQGDF